MRQITNNNTLLLSKMNGISRLFSLYCGAILFYVLCVYSQDVAYPYNHFEQNSVSHSDQKNRSPLYAPNRCPPNQLLYPGDHMDDWICDCSPGFVFLPSHNKCFAVFRQGPCKKGFHLVLGNKSVIPECVENPCQEGFARFSNGNCYELGRPGEPCPEEIIGGGVFGINETTLLPQCVKRLNPNVFNYIDKHTGRNSSIQMKSTTVKLMTSVGPITKNAEKPVLRRKNKKLKD